MIDVPALRGDDPLGFLAALGVLGLAEIGSIPPLKLGWTTSAAPTARFDGDVTSTDELADQLSDAFAQLREEGLPGPGLLPEFPIARTGGGTDPMRVRSAIVAEWYANADATYRAGDPWLARWLVAIAGQSAVADEKRDDVRLTPFYAPTGRMTLRGSLFDSTAEAVERLGGPGDAVVGWRRTVYDGANFDGRATRDGAVTTTGKPANQGAPSATWLALMGLRFFTITDDGRQIRTMGWQPVRMYEGYTSRSLVWPCWQPALDAPAVRSLLSHPVLQLEAGDDGPRVTRHARRLLPPLGVVAVFGASRRSLSQGDGPLGRARRLWARGAVGAAEG